MKKLPAHAAVLLAALASPTAGAQKIDQAKVVDVGDKATYNWVLNGKAQQLEEEWKEVNGSGVVGVQRVGGKEFALVLPRFGVVTEAICQSNGQPCTFSPGLTVIDMPLEKGRKWKQTFTVKGETFTAELDGDYEVDKVEKVKTPAGEFESFRIAHGARIRGADAKGKPFSGKEDGRYWVAAVNGKLVIVKSEYRNSFGEKYTRDVTSISYK